MSILLATIALICLGCDKKEMLTRSTALFAQGLYDCIVSHCIVVSLRFWCCLCGVCVCACVGACMRVCVRVRACVRVCVRACERAHICACHVYIICI